MKKVLFAWTGNKDFEAAEENRSSSLGAIGMAVTTREFDELVLLSDSAPDKTTRYREWLASKQVKNVKIIPIDLGGNPNDYKAIYESAKRSVQDYLNEQIIKGNEMELTFHLAPGTPAMATIWVILAPIFPAKLIHSSPERGIQDVVFPFDIATEYIPEVLKRKGRTISSLFSDYGPETLEFKAIIHRSAIMKNLIERAKMLAPYGDVSVLIEGETGTGKELLAKAIHSTSPRKDKKIISVNCGAISASLLESELFGVEQGVATGVKERIGLIEAASGGTLFLDEVGEMPLEMQVKLLRFIQEKKFCRVGERSERPVDVRIIAATNRNLSEEISDSRFREDLFHRLAVGMLYLPPLREREGDVSLLIDHHMREINNKCLKEIPEYIKKKLSAAARSLLLHHSWPGNVRELENTLMRAVIWSIGEVIDKQDIEDAMLKLGKKCQGNGTFLGRSLGGDFDLNKVVSEVATHYLELAMKESGRNKTKAAKALNLKSYQALDVWLKRYKID